MIQTSRRQRIIAAVGTFLAVALVLGGIWLVRDRGDNAPPQAGSPATPSTEPSTEPGAPPTVAPATMTVTVFFHRGQNADPATVVAVRRTVPKTAKVATASVKQLLAGPTAAERKAGYWSHFSAATAGMLRSVRISGGVAHADFRDFRAVIPQASSSTGSTVLLAELDATLKQFSTVRSTMYSFNGDVGSFYEWLQMTPPGESQPTLSEARRVAGNFLARVVGMKNPAYVAARWRSDFIATVDFRSSTGGPVTTVTLGKGKTSFSVLDTITSTIRVDTPKSVITPSDLPVVTSPVTVAGAALTFEGAVALRVVEVTGTSVRGLGTGQAIAGGDVMRPFSGTVSFTKPGADTGWVIAFERSARDGTITKATTVRVAFTAVG